MQNKYSKTITACFIGYIVQAIVNVFVPLLFINFQTAFNIPIEKITLLITINFFIQLITDTAAAWIVDKIGYRICTVSAHISAAAGLLLLSFLPQHLEDPYMGLIISVVLYAVGGGLIEVVISPIVEACPGEHKDKTMSLLHSFYCWGSVGVILISALFFFVFGIDNWRVLSILWAVLPLANAIVFSIVPLPSDKSKHHAANIVQLIKNKYFWLFFAVIFCAGASESAIAQWASVFAESSLKVSKTIGDIVGPALFAASMGLCRLLYGKASDKINLEKAMTASGILCTVFYLIIALVPYPPLALTGMALCGFSVGLMWPGTYSCAAAAIKDGGNAMFALLALGGDLGCVGGPAVVGFVSGCFNGNMQPGILLAAVFPACLTAALLLGRKSFHK